MGIVSDLLNKRTGEVERPPLLPIGTYRWEVKDTPVQDVSKTGTEFVRFPCRPLEALDGVDEDQLAAYGTLALTVVSKAFYFSDEPEAKMWSERNAFEMTQFLEAIGASDGDVTTSQALASSKGLSFIADASWRQDKNNPELYFVEIGRVIPDEQG